MKVNRFARKTFFFQKNAQKQPFLAARNLGILTLGGAVYQTVDTRSTFGLLWLVWGIMVRTSYVEGRWHRNWARNRLSNLFLRVAKETSKKQKCFTLWAVIQKQREILWEVTKGEMTDRHWRTNAFLTKIGCRAFLTVFLSPKVGWRRQNAKIKSLLLISYDRKWFDLGRSKNLKTYGTFFRVTPLLGRMFFFKRGSTSAARNLVLDTPWAPTPLCQAYSEPSGHEDSPLHQVWPNIYHTY